jgi:hypothetical protein
MRFDKLAYVAGETAQVLADIDNESTKDLGMKVKLRRIFKIKTSDGEAVRCCEAITLIMSFGSLWLTCCLRGLCVCVGLVDWQDLTEDIIVNEYPPMLKKTNKKDQPYPLRLVGDKVKPSCQGNFISCSYQYLVHCAVSWGKDMDFEVPVTVYMVSRACALSLRTIRLSSSDVLTSDCCWFSSSAVCARSSDSPSRLPPRRWL